jgi:hypothetical protein
VGRVMEGMNESTIVQGLIRQPPATDDEGISEVLKKAMCSNEFRIPDETQIGNVFLYSFHTKKESYTKHFHSLSADVITLDHTFHSRYLKKYNKSQHAFLNHIFVVVLF